MYRCCPAPGVRARSMTSDERRQAENASQTPPTRIAFMIAKLYRPVAGRNESRRAAAGRRRADPAVRSASTSASRRSRGGILDPEEVARDAALGRHHHDPRRVRVLVRLRRRRVAEPDRAGELADRSGVRRSGSASPRPAPVGRSARGTAASFPRRELGRVARVDADRHDLEVLARRRTGSRAHRAEHVVQLERAEHRALVSRRGSGSPARRPK